MIKNFLKQFSKLVLPSAFVGGFQISNSSIRFLQFAEGKKGGQAVSGNFSLRLPPGLVEGGRVKDKEAFMSALKSLREKISVDRRRNIHVILSIPAGDVYVQAFNLPVLSDVNLGEAAELNMKVISPNPIETTYYSWKEVGRNTSGSGQIEILGAFASREIVDELIGCLEEAGFGVAAVEFSSLSLVRMLESFGVINQNGSYLLIKITEEGLIFIIIRNNNLYFNYFHAWEKFAETGVSLESIAGIIYSESQRVMNFYTGRWGGQIDDILFIAPVYGPELSQLIQKKYPSKRLIVLDSNKDNLHGVRGAALRGSVGRMEDEDINLMNPGAINSFYRDRIMSFAGLWRNAAVTAFSFILVLFISTSLFLRSQAGEVKERESYNLKQSDAAEFIELQSKAAAFNALSSSLSKVKESIAKIYPYMKKINDTAGANVSITSFSISAPGPSVVLQGIAKNENEVVAFKDKLTALPEIGRELDFPLQGVKIGADGRASFSASFQIKKQ